MRSIRLSITVITAAIGFILVGMSNTLTLTIIGVACTAFSSGIGESSLLSFTVFYKDKLVSSVIIINFTTYKKYNQSI